MLLDQLERVLAWISAAMAFVAKILIAAIAGMMFYEVIMRYVVGQPTLWVYETSLWFGSIVFLISGVTVMEKRGHIRVTVIYDVVSSGTRRIFDGLSALLTCIFAFCLVFGSFNEARDKLLRWETLGTIWNTPVLAVVKPLLLVVVTLIAIQAVVYLFVDREGRRIDQPKIDVE